MNTRRFVRACALAVCTLSLVSCGLRPGWPGVSEPGTPATPTCTGNACNDVLVTWLGEGQGYEIRNKGAKNVIVRIRFATFLDCDGATEIPLSPGARQTYLNGAYCPPYEAVVGGSGGGVDPGTAPPRIASFSITPATVQAGTSVDMKIRLDKAAPAGGTTVGYSLDTQTGVTSTIPDIPVSFRFNQGVSEATIPLRTKRVVPEATRIVFTVYTANSSASATLIVN